MYQQSLSVPGTFWSSPTSSSYRWTEDGRENPSCGNGTQPHSQPSSHSSSEWWSLVSLACPRKMDGCRKQERKQKARGKIQVEVGNCWASEAVKLAVVWMESLGGYRGEEVTICYPVPAPLYRWGNAEPEKGNDLPKVSGLRSGRGRVTAPISAFWACIPYMASLKFSNSDSPACS